MGACKSRARGYAELGQPANAPASGQARQPVAQPASPPVCQSASNQPNDTFVNPVMPKTDPLNALNLEPFTGPILPISEEDDYIVFQPVALPAGPNQPTSPPVCQSASNQPASLPVGEPYVEPLKTKVHDDDDDVTCTPCWRTPSGNES